MKNEYINFLKMTWNITSNKGNKKNIFLIMKWMFKIMIIEKLLWNDPVIDILGITSNL